MHLHFVFCMHLNISPSRKLKWHWSSSPVQMGENLTKATLLTFSLTKLDGVQTEILYHVLTRARGAADTVSHAWNLHHWACSERYSGSESDCSAAGQIFTPRSLCLPRVSTVCCWWGLRQHIVTAAPTELISPATVKGKEQPLSSDVFYCNYTPIFIFIWSLFISQCHCTCASTVKY